jgi:hypothetical protein
MFLFFGRLFPHEHREYNTSSNFLFVGRWCAEVTLKYSSLFQYFPFSCVKQIPTSMFFQTFITKSEYIGKKATTDFIFVLCRDKYFK